VLFFTASQIHAMLCRYENKVWYGVLVKFPVHRLKNSL